LEYKEKHEENKRRIPNSINHLCLPIDFTGIETSIACGSRACDSAPVIPSTDVSPDESKVKNCQTALDNYGQGANVLNNHVSA